MTWKPTEGLRRAESVVQQILNDLVACGVAPITNPTARWRMVQVVGQALDGFGRNADVSEFLETKDSDLIFRDDDPEPNGLYDDGPEAVQLKDAIMPSLATHKDPAVVDQYTDKPAKRRGRGRPRLSAAEKRKRKAAKQAAAVEAGADAS